MATKFKGKSLSLLVDTQEYNADGTSVVLDNEDADSEAITFSELDNGDPKDWFFQLNAVSDYGSTSFWTMLWENAGSDVAYIFKPYGNAEASVEQPHFTGTVTIKSKPPIGGEAGSVWTYEARLDCTDEPTRVTG